MIANTLIICRKSMWLPFVQRCSRSFQTLYRGAKRRRLKPYRTQSTVERWRWTFAIVTLSSLPAALWFMQLYSCVVCRFYRNCWGTICKSGTRCCFSLFQPRWDHFLCIQRRKKWVHEIANTLVWLLGRQHGVHFTVIFFDLFNFNYV